MVASKISIVTPSYNQGQFIEETIDSVLSQNYPNLEYIIIDGGSTDHTLEIIKKYEKHLSYWISEKDQGQSDAINKGLKKATGEIFNWINSDDYYEKETFAKISAIFQDKNINCLCGNSKIFNNLNEKIIYSGGTTIYYENTAKTIGFARIDQPATFFRKEKLTLLGNLSEALHYTMDLEWWLKYLINYGLDGIYKTADVLVNFRIHEQSKTNTSQREFFLERNLIFHSIARQLGMTKEAEVISGNGNVKDSYYFNIPKNFDLNLLKSSINYFLLLRGDECYYENQTNAARKYLDTVNKNSLTKPDQHYLSKLILKNKYIPITIRNLYQRKKYGK